MQRNSLSEHPFLKRVKIYQGILSSDFCEKIIGSYPSIDKIDNSGEWRDNLLNTHRTVGDAHSHPEVQEVWRGICGLMSGVWNTENDPFFHSVMFDLHASWVAVSQGDAVVEPHIHASNPGVWSFVFYAAIPGGKSSLVFSDTDTENIKVTVREGDVLFFPADLMHFSFDTMPGRTIFSGNFAVHCRYGAPQ